MSADQSRPSRLNERERMTLLALASPDQWDYMSIRIRVTHEERERIKRAAAQGGYTVSTWAELNLTDLAIVELSGTEAGHGL